LLFLVDAQLPSALARRIQTLGHIGEHVFDCGLAKAPDHVIRNYAASKGAVIVSKDEDHAVFRLLRGGP
jgi:predicted nuclease of predicted toxin-antitoxin system